MAKGQKDRKEKVSQAQPNYREGQKRANKLCRGG
jgi:hypothetical protein